MYDLNREKISGLRSFEGEDIYAGDRKRLQQLQMNDWITQ